MALLYAIVEADRKLDVSAVRKRPPYDYGDLASLLEEYAVAETDAAHHKKSKDKKKRRPIT